MTVDSESTASLNVNYGSIPQQEMSGQVHHEVIGDRHEHGSSDERKNKFNDDINSKKIFWSFVAVTVCFTMVFASGIACLSLAVPRLGELGAHQSIILYISYSLSSASGFTSFVVETWNSRIAIIIGLMLVNTYVLCFWFGAVVEGHSSSSTVLVPYAVYGGAIVGGAGAGLCWTAQGTYFANAADEYSQHSRDATTLFGSIFASIYLFMEATMDASSSILLFFTNTSWSTIFAIYAVLAFVGTVVSAAVLLPKERRIEHNAANNNNDDDLQNRPPKPTKLFRTINLLRTNQKLRQTIGFNAAFGLASAYMNSVVAGGIVGIAWNDADNRKIGILTAGHALFAAFSSSLQGMATAPTTGHAKTAPFLKSTMIQIGGACCCLVGCLFLVLPKSIWSWQHILFIYMVHGAARGTFEGTLRAWVAEHSMQDKEDAFSGLVLVNGISAALGYCIASYSVCSPDEVDGLSSLTCIEYGSDHSYHSVWLLQLGIVVLGLFGVWQMKPSTEDGHDQHSLPVV